MGLVCTPIFGKRMMKNGLKIYGAMLLALASATAMGGSITVTEPAAGSIGNPTLIGKTAKIRFNTQAGTNATKVTVTATIKKISDNSIIGVQSGEATPDTDGKASGEVPLAFAENVTEEVPYRIEVRAREDGRPGEVYNPIDIFVLPDLTKPKILQFNPNTTTFVRGIVPVIVRIQEPNLKDWRIQVNNQDIPLNTGTTVNGNGEFTVNWNTNGLQTDEAKTINVRVRDKADNETTLGIEVTVDRLAPTVNFAAPRSGATISPGTTISVSIDVTDFNQAALDTSGVDVVARRMDGSFITRVARISYNGTGNNSKRWVGRIRWRQGLLPSQFKLVASVVDRAGNAASPQSVLVRLGR